MEWITLVGFFAATFTTIAFLPQVIKTIKTKCTKDLSLIMYSILTFGILLWLTYGVLIKDWPIIIANLISLVFAVIILGLKIKYK